jgi:hypothetical protein
MKTGYEDIYPLESFTPNYQQPSPPRPGINLRDHITIAAMQGMLARLDGGIFNPDEVADKACTIAEAMLRRMP